MSSKRIQGRWWFKIGWMSEGGTDCQNKTGRAITDLEGVGQYLNRGGGGLWTMLKQTRGAIHKWIMLEKNSAGAK